MPSSPLPPELQSLSDALDAAELDARNLVAGLSEERGTWHVEPGSWSVAQCLDHLGTGNRVYLAAMRPHADRARRQGRLRRRPALPGFPGRWFVNSLEPPVKPRKKMKAPAKIRPQVEPSLGEAMASFFGSQDEVRVFLRTYADIDLAGVHFPNPFVRGLRWSLATGLHVIPAHERRHLWQAWNVRRAADELTRQP